MNLNVKFFNELCIPASYSYICNEQKTKRIIKHLVKISFGKVVSIITMMFLIGFLTVGNAFLFGGVTTNDTSIASAGNNDDDCSKRPINPEEEKSSRSASNSLAEEYLHDHNHFNHLYVTIASSQEGDIHSHGFGDDHSSLDCPPPDLS